MRFANPAGLALLALAIPVLLTHVLRPRRTSMAVPSVLLWRRVERPVSAAQPWQRLRWSLLLLAQLLAVILLALAVARPERLSATPLAEHTVFIVDASGSMAATDGSPDRLAAARERAAELRDELPGGGIASIVVAGDVPRVALTASADGDEFSRALRTVDQSRGRPTSPTRSRSPRAWRPPTRRSGSCSSPTGGWRPKMRPASPAGRASNGSASVMSTGRSPGSPSSGATAGCTPA